MAERPWAEIRPLLDTEIEDKVKALKVEPDPIAVARLQAGIAALEWVIERSKQPTVDDSGSAEDALY